MSDKSEVSSQAQLALIKQIHELLERARVDHWLYGGWAVDFRLGTITRAHSDIDMLI